MDHTYHCDYTIHSSAERDRISPSWLCKFRSCPGFCQLAEQLRLQDLYRVRGDNSRRNAVYSPSFTRLVVCAVFVRMLQILIRRGIVVAVVRNGGLSSLMMRLCWSGRRRQGDGRVYAFDVEVRGRGRRHCACAGWSWRLLKNSTD